MMSDDICLCCHNRISIVYAVWNKYFPKQLPEAVISSSSKRVWHVRALYQITIGDRLRTGKRDHLDPRIEGQLENPFPSTIIPNKNRASRHP